jgi:hypothetical protein
MTARPVHERRHNRCATRKYCRPAWRAGAEAVKPATDAQRVGGTVG